MTVHTPNVLEMIDGAIGDWETGEDAMRRDYLLRHGFQPFEPPCDCGNCPPPAPVPVREAPTQGAPE